MKKIIFFCLVTLLLVFGLSKTTFANNNQQESTVILEKGQTVNKDYFAAGSNVSVHGTVNGDAYVAGGNVLIDGDINGDLIATGGTLIINGQISEDIRVAGGNVIINNSQIEGNATIAGGQITLGDNASVSGSIVATGGQLNLSGPIGKEANLAGGQISIGNSVNGDVIARTENIRLTNNAKINGDLTYYSSNEANIDQGATVSGTTNQIETAATPQENVWKGAAAFFFATAIIFKVIGFIASFIIGILLILFTPIFTQKVSEVIRKRTWLSLGIGVLTMILIPIIFIVLLMTIIGIPIAFIFLPLALIAIYFSKIYISYSIGEMIIKNRNTHRIWVLLLGLVIFSIVAAIPIIGGIFQFFAYAIGLGGLLIADKNLLAELRNKKQI